MGWHGAPPTSTEVVMDEVDTSNTKDQEVPDEVDTPASEDREASAGVDTPSTKDHEILAEVHNSVIGTQGIAELNRKLNVSDNELSGVNVWLDERQVAHDKEFEKLMAELEQAKKEAATHKLNIAQNIFAGEDKKTKKGKIKKGREFVLLHCYEVLKDLEKWKARDDREESKKRKATIDLDDEEEASSDDVKRRPTPNSVAYSKSNRPNGSKKDAKEKKKRRGDDESMNAMDSLL
ncbi:Tyrosine N-monooxygenase [Hordeum vulgare]|nr:Tyrosine N-monooxygenase [Hordeum vulgare]